MNHSNGRTRYVAALLAGACFAMSSVASAADHTGAPTSRSDEPVSEQRGFIWNFGLAAVAPAGKWADVPGASMGDIMPGAGMSLSFGAYFHRHLGFTAGGRVSAHSLGGDSCTKSTSDDGCQAFSVQVPVMLEYAFDTRKQGLYTEAGLGLLTHYFFVGRNGGGSVGNNFGEMKGGLGYRIPASAFAELKGKPSRGSLDFFANVDVGQFDKVSVHAGDVSANADITKRAWHYTFEIGVRIHRTE